MLQLFKLEQKYWSIISKMWKYSGTYYEFSSTRTYFNEQQHIIHQTILYLWCKWYEGDIDVKIWGVFRSFFHFLTEQLIQKSKWINDEELSELQPWFKHEKLNMCLKSFHFLLTVAALLQILWLLQPNFQAKSKVKNKLISI